MNIETITLKIPGLKRKYVFYHTSDCHLAWAGTDENAEAHAKAEEMTRFWSYAGLAPADALQQALRLAEADDADGLFLCGDAVDYLSTGSLTALQQALASTTPPKFYVCGNHERSGADPSGRQAFYPAYQNLMHGSPGFWSQDFGEFVIAGVDNGDKQIQQEQLDALETVCTKGKPVLVLIHIPIMTDAILDPVRQKWGENGPDYFLLGQESDTALSRQFCRMLADPALPIAAVFAGHIHLSHTGEIIPGRMQYTSAPTFEGVLRKVILEAE